MTSQEVRGTGGWHPSQTPKPRPVSPKTGWTAQPKRSSDENRIRFAWSVLLDQRACRRQIGGADLDKNSITMQNFFSTMATNVYKLGGDNCVEAEWRRLCKSWVAANVYKLGGGNCVEAKWRRLRGGDCVKARWRRMCTS